MVSIAKILSSFDRKEKALLVRQARGARPLEPSFCKELTEKLALDPPLHPDSWWGLDYHLSWLMGALRSFKYYDRSRLAGEWEPSVPGINTSHIDDVDLIIADESRVILIEAKASGNWNEKDQLKNKLARLMHISKDRSVSDLSGVNQVELYFVLISIDNPTENPKILALDWPEWALRDGRPVWIELKHEHDGLINTIEHKKDDKVISGDVDDGEHPVGFWRVTSKIFKKFAGKTGVQLDEGVDQDKDVGALDDAVGITDGKKSVRKMVGHLIFNRHHSGTLQFGWMGREGGIDGALKDIEGEDWSDRSYFVGNEKISDKWFPISDFCDLVTKKRFRS